MSDPLTTSTYDGGTEVFVQSNENGEIHEAVVDAEGKVKDAENGAVFNADEYELMGVLR